MFTLAVMNKWKLFIPFFILICASCKSPNNEMVPAENGLDAGREFIDGCLKGDFIKADFYMLQDELNVQFLKSSHSPADRHSRPLGGGEFDSKTFQKYELIPQRQV